MTGPKRRYTDQGYESELKEIRERLLLMAGRVEGIILRAVDAYVRRNSEEARGIVELDRDINRDEVELDALCLQLLACRQPMASDLRFVTLTMKMVTDLERIGDLSVNICERTVDLADTDLRVANDSISLMGRKVQSMLHDAIDAFVQRDTSLARAVIDRDDAVDDLYDEVFAQILDLMRTQQAGIHRGIHIQSVAKYLERMADHSTNIAEQVIFMLKGQDVRHEGKLQQDG